MYHPVRFPCPYCGIKFSCDNTLKAHLHGYCSGISNKINPDLLLNKKIPLNCYPLVNVSPQTLLMDAMQNADQIDTEKCFRSGDLMFIALKMRKPENSSPSHDALDLSNSDHSESPLDLSNRSSNRKRTHSDDQPQRNFVCTGCGIQFSAAFTLNQHQLRYCQHRLILPIQKDVHSAETNNKTRKEELDVKDEPQEMEE